MHTMLVGFCGLLAASLLHVTEAGRCSDGFYDPSCGLKCSEHCYGSRCEADSRRGTFRCTEGCSDGWTGVTCERKCPRGCKKSCDFAKGTCTDCLDDWCGDQCHQICITEEASNSKPPNCRDNTCAHCMDGWHGPDCRSPCPEHCESGCDKASGVCDHQCVKGYHGVYCSTPCTSTCTDGCRQTDGVCTGGCHKGWFGPHCNMSCNVKCLDDTCYQMSGECTNSQIMKALGLTESRCGRVWVNGEKVTNCSAGCQPGWRGERCDQKCPEACYTCSRYPDGHLCIFRAEVIVIKNHGVAYDAAEGSHMRLVFALLLVIPPFAIVGIMQLLRLSYAKYKKRQTDKTGEYTVTERVTL